MGLPGRAPTGPCLAHLRLQLRRSFSSSPVFRKNGPLAAFPKTSSTELDDIVDTFRKNVFFPNHISKFDREMIYRPAKHFYLTGEEPVKTRVHVSPAATGKKLPKVKDEKPPVKKEETKRLSRATAPAIYPQKKPPLPKETFVMSPINILNDIPKLQPNYRKMLKLMSSPSDFAIVPDFLREVNMTQTKITPEMLARTVRRAAELDCVDLIMHAFLSTDRIGLRINHPAIVSQLMQAIVMHAANGYWTQDRLDKALIHSDSVLLMLRDPQHRVQHGSEPYEDSLQLPQIWGAAMALTAIRQLRFGPRDATPHRYGLDALAQRFLERLQLDQLGNASATWSVQNMWLADWAPAIFGTKYAIQALGAADAAAMKLQLALPALDDAAATAAAKVTEAFPDADQERLGLKMARTMETALEVESPAAPLIDEAIFVESDGEAVFESESAASEPDTPLVETKEAATDASEVHPEKKDAT